MKCPLPKPAPGTFTVSREFAADFAYVAQMEHWDAADIAEFKEVIKKDRRMMDYIATLALAYHNWYEQTEANGYPRVYSWLGEVKLEPVTKYGDVTVSI